MPATSPRTMPRPTPSQNARPVNFFGLRWSVRGLSSRCSIIRRVGLNANDQWTSLLPGVPTVNLANLSKAVGPWHTDLLHHRQQLITDG